ncbi:uncharacterized protein LOC110226144 [Arabidopsis lyrata subsp. lyrata]|uniref:uncharacterized protein LOC110226144 n=1 Tax=Arabidopsis lyrata subsp. lyrata TaxID=81972 RepID=UPI000A29E945|nr:uncharacterized protein LOC110226144 [Arabidopsis lyrata subsp. lyrata]|eukprot:XP_020872460.1 uncharacterized protein LOC110226144 [Arabidopsis lyrata subsp. lyrata]
MRFQGSGGADHLAPFSLPPSLSLSQSKSLSLCSASRDVFFNEEEAMCGKQCIYRERDGDRTVFFCLFRSSRDWPVKTLVSGLSKKNLWFSKQGI